MRGRDFSFGGEEAKSRGIGLAAICVEDSNSDDEFFDALENTQALHLANEDALNSPTLKLVE